MLLTGRARRLIKEKEKAVKGDHNILSFLKPNTIFRIKYCSEEEDNPLTLPSLGK